MYLITILSNCNGKEIEIGVILPLSGSASTMGNEVKDALELAVDELNHHNGANDKQLNLIIRNSETDFRKSEQAFKEIEKEHTPLLYLSATSLTAVAVSALCEQHKVVLAGCVVSSPNFTKGKDYSYRYYPDSISEIAPIVKMVASLGIERLGVLYAKEEWGIEAYNQLLAQAKLELKSLTIQALSYPLGTTQFRSYIENLFENDGIYILGFRDSLKELLIELQRQKYLGKILAPSTATIPEIREMKESNGVYVSGPLIYHSKNEFVQNISKTFENRFGYEISHFGANAYDFILMIGNLLEGRESVDRKSFKAIFEEGFIYAGLLGTVYLKSGENEIDVTLHQAVIRDGNLEYLQ